MRTVLLRSANEHEFLAMYAEALSRSENESPLLFTIRYVWYDDIHIVLKLFEAFVSLFLQNVMR